MVASPRTFKPSLAPFGPQPVKAGVQSGSLPRTPRGMTCVEMLKNHEALQKIVKRNPWDINIKASVSSFMAQAPVESEIQRLRVGGRVLYSASMVVNAKSCLVIQSSTEALHDACLEVEELMEDPPEWEEDFTESFGDADVLPDSGSHFEGNLVCQTAPDALKPPVAGIELAPAPVVLSEPPRTLINQLAAQSKSLMTEDEFINQINTVELNLVPRRKSFRKLQLAEMATALDQTIKSLGSGSARVESYGREETPSVVLPQNFLERAEQERARVEEQIEIMGTRIRELYTGTPIPFLSVLVEPSRGGIVRTLLYLLHLTNRHAVELWQEFGEENGDNAVDCLDASTILVVPVVGGN